MNLEKGRWIFSPGSRRQVAMIRESYGSMVKTGWGAVQEIVRKSDIAAVYDTEVEAEAAHERYRESRKWSASAVIAAAEKLSAARVEYELVLKNAKEMAIKQAIGDGK